MRPAVRTSSPAGAVPVPASRKASLPMPAIPSPFRRIVAAALCAGSALAADPAQAGVPEPTVLAKASQPPTIDGRLDDPCWQVRPAIPIDHPNGPDRPRRVPTPASVRYAWDEHYLYLAYETFDANLVALGSGERQGPAANRRDGCQIWSPEAPVDVVEFFISLGDQRFFWELHHNALNQFNDVWCVTTDPSWPIHQAQMNPYGILFHFEEYLQDEGERTLASAVALKPKADGSPSTVAADKAAADTDVGYTAEVRIPWLSLGTPRDRALPKQPGTWNLDGLVIAVLAVVQDGDLADRYHRSAPFGASGWFHHDVLAWPRYRLAESAP
jgi:hypothetical protein